MRTDANKISLRALRSLLAGARPFELEVAGKPVRCSSPRPAVPWPAMVVGVSHAEDGPEWPAGVNVECTWPEGRCVLEVEVFHWTAGRYLHDLCMLASTLPERRAVTTHPEDSVLLNRSCQLTDEDRYEHTIGGP